MRHALPDLWDIIEEQRKEIEKIEANQADLVEQAEEKYGSFEETPAAIDDTYAALEDRRYQLEQTLDAAERRLEALDENPVIEDPAPGEESGWDNTQVHIKELSIGDVAQISDRVGIQVEGAQEALETGEGAAMVEALRMAVVRGPEGAPDDPADWPPVIGKLILMKVSELGGMPNEEEMGKSSLREQMAT